MLIYGVRTFVLPGAVAIFIFESCAKRSLGKPIKYPREIVLRLIPCSVWGMATTKPQSPAAPKPLRPTGSVSLKNLTFFKTVPAGVTRPPAEYATSGIFCYERILDEEGKPRYRRALWSRILETAGSAESWLNHPKGIWSPISDPK